MTANKITEIRTPIMEKSEGMLESQGVPSLISTGLLYVRMQMGPMWGTALELSSEHLLEQENELNNPHDDFCDVKTVKHLSTKQILSPSTLLLAS
jgi:hypothetical protein